jgi:small subunit ribosomal protein S6
VNDYEIMLLLDPELTEERGNEIIQRIRTSVEGANGTWDGHEPWGRRRLEYEIDHKSEAVYHLLLFTAPPETLAEITRVLKITDGVMRHGAFRRVKGASTKAPAQSPAPTPAAAEPVAVEAAAIEPETAEPETAEPETAEPVTSEAADDTVQVPE